MARTRRRTLRLTGQVTREALTAVLDGRDPATGSELWTPSRSRLPGWDLTFSGPKGVSLLYALAPGACRRVPLEALRAYVDQLQDRSTAQPQASVKKPPRPRSSPSRCLVTKLVTRRAENQGNGWTSVELIKL
jgi:hypothetical protein